MSSRSIYFNRIYLSLTVIIAAVLKRSHIRDLWWDRWARGAFIPGVFLAGCIFALPWLKRYVSIKKRHIYHLCPAIPRLNRRSQAILVCVCPCHLNIFNTQDAYELKVFCIRVWISFTSHSPLEDVTPAAARGLVGCQAEFTAVVLQAGWTHRDACQCGSIWVYWECELILNEDRQVGITYWAVRWTQQQSSWRSL